MEAAAVYTYINYFLATKKNTLNQEDGGLNACVKLIIMLIDC